MTFQTLSFEQLLELHAESIRIHGGAHGVRDQGLLESALSQPRASFGGIELYPTLVEKAAALAFSLAKNHGFIDGNKRIAFSAMEVFLRINGWEIEATADHGETAILGVASSTIHRDAFTEWVKSHVQPLN